MVTGGVRTDGAPSEGIFQVDWARLRCSTAEATSRWNTTPQEDPMNVLDGSFLSWWSSEDLDHAPRHEVRFTVDLGAERSVSRVCIFWGDDKGRNRAHSRTFQVLCGPSRDEVKVAAQIDNVDVPVDAFASHRLGATYTEVLLDPNYLTRSIVLRLQQTAGKWCNHAVQSVQAWGMPTEHELADLLHERAELAVHGASSALGLISPKLVRRAAHAAARRAAYEPSHEPSPARNLMAVFDSVGSNASELATEDNFESVVMPHLPHHVWNEVASFFGRREFARAVTLCRPLQLAFKDTWKTHPMRIMLDWARHSRCLAWATSTRVRSRLDDGQSQASENNEAAPEDPRYSAHHALDGTHSTAWCSKSATTRPVIFAVDMGAVLPVSCIQMHWGTERGCTEHPQGMQVQCSADGRRFETVYRLDSVTRIYADDGFLSTINDIRISQRHVRYVRLLLTHTQPHQGSYALRTLSVWGFGDPREEDDLTANLRPASTNAQGVAQYAVPCDSTGMPGLVTIH